MQCASTEQFTYLFVFNKRSHPPSDEFQKRYPISNKLLVNITPITVLLARKYLFIAALQPSSCNR